MILRQMIITSLLFLQICFAAPPLISPAGTSDAAALQMIADRIRSNMNTSADPCDDFYQYVCGNYEEPEEKLNSGIEALDTYPIASNSPTFTKVYDFMSACMDRETIDIGVPQRILQKFNSLGGWPMLDSSWKEYRYDLTNLLIQLMLSPRHRMFFEIDTNPDLFNPKRQIITVSPIIRDDDDGFDHFNPQSKSHGISAVLNFGKDDDGIPMIVRKFIQESNANISKEKISADVKEINEIFDEIMSITIKGSQIMNSYNKADMFTTAKLSDLQKYIPSIDWQRLLLGIFPTSTQDYIRSNPDIYILKLDIMKNVARLVTKYTPRAITNYLMYVYAVNWQTMTLYNISPSNSRMSVADSAKRCNGIVRDYLPQVYGAFYVRKHFDRESKEMISQMLENIHRTFIKMLKNNDWMDEETKKAAIFKAKKMTRLSSYPEMAMNDGLLDEYHKDLNWNSSTSLFDIIERITIWMRNSNFNKLLKPTDYLEFQDAPQTENAYYAPGLNQFAVLAGISKMPYFHREGPMAFNYAGIGLIIGHEMGHAFDSTGSEFDWNGAYHNWWTDSTRSIFLKKAECLVKQYNKAEFTWPGGIKVKLYGNITKDEDIADNAGVKEAYWAYKYYLSSSGEDKQLPGFEKYSNEKMFFISHTFNHCQYVRLSSTKDEHSPKFARGYIPLTNFDEFAKAFSCKKGTRMNPEKQCPIW